MIIMSKLNLFFGLNVKFTQIRGCSTTTYQMNLREFDRMQICSAIQP